MTYGPADIALRPATVLTAAELAVLFNAGYEGYQFPIELDEAAFTVMADASDFDLGLSFVAVRGDRPVGVVALGVRGAAAWIGGLGVVSDERRRGIGRTLMGEVLDAAVAAGLREVSLEVLESNVGAIALYDGLGFVTTRMLEVWTLDGELGSTAADQGGFEQAHAWIRAHRRYPEPWQRADDSLAQSPHGMSAVVLDDQGAALYWLGGDAADILQLGALTVAAAEELLRALRGRGTRLRFVNVPEGDVASAAMRELGGRLEVRQHEMAWAPP